MLDFYCASAKVAVEVDGQQHWVGDTPLRDIERDAWLGLRGIRVLRLSARLIFDDIDAAILMIEDAGTPPKSPHP